MLAFHAIHAKYMQTLIRGVCEEFVHRLLNNWTAVTHSHSRPPIGCLRLPSSWRWSSANRVMIYEVIKHAATSAWLCWTAWWRPITVNPYPPTHLATWYIHKYTSTLVKLINTLLRIFVGNSDGYSGIHGAKQYLNGLPCCAHIWVNIALMDCYIAVGWSIVTLALA